MNAVVQLPDIASATLPAAYVEACSALAQCERIDECWEWADRMAALASYARQSKDDQLFNNASRIRARAVRRAGELLQEVEPARGARTDLGGAPPLSRKAAADAAGLSDYQRKDALRVANVPADMFNAQVESSNPPTITELAEQGTNKQSTTTPVAQGALRLWGRLRDFEREGWLDQEPAEVMLTLTDEMRDDVHSLAPRVAAWLRRVGELHVDQK